MMTSSAPGPAPADSRGGTLEISSDLRELARVRTFLREVCQRGFSPPAVEDRLIQFELAVTEAVSNIIRHGYHGQPGRSLKLAAAPVQDQLTLRITHRGDPFEPGPGAGKTLEGPREGRMGLYLIRECVDEVHYGADPDGESYIFLSKKMTEG